MTQNNFEVLMQKYSMYGPSREFRTYAVAESYEEAEERAKEKYPYDIILKIIKLTQ